MEGTRKISLLNHVIDLANDSKQFKEANIFLTVQVNAINNRVDIWNHNDVIMSAKEVNLSKAFDQIMKWIIISGIPPFNNLNIHIENEEFKIISKD